MGLVATKPVFGVSVKGDSNQSPQLQRLTRISKFLACSMFRDYTFQKANNKGADQSARMHRLVCAFVVRKLPKTGFLSSRPKYILPFHLIHDFLCIVICWALLVVLKPSLKCEGINSSGGTRQMLMYQKNMFDCYYCINSFCCFFNVYLHA